MAAVTRLSSILRLAIGFLFVAVISTLWLAVAIPLLPWRVLRIKLCNYYGKFVGYTLVRLAGSRLELTNRDRINESFPAIYVANHTSTLDAFLSIWLCPVGGCGVVKREVARVPFFGQLYVLSGHLLLDRGHRDKAVAALDDVAKLVRKHRLAIWIMPEGTRSKTGRLQPFKVGFVHLAIATGLPVVPVVLHGVHRIWPPGSMLVSPGVVKVRVLEPISTAEWRADTAQLHAKEVHDLIARALPEDQQP
jgi:1-acyl-sn-glycerol-3-phosphate acyltransferase